MNMKIDHGSEGVKRRSELSFSCLLSPLRQRSFLTKHHTEPDYKAAPIASHSQQSRIRPLMEWV
ncbi:hypothetical protein E2C01_091564 [Portunus trituberculatus]|uniref:Uncharacterized protein n=1 Tax=Portunus trituberculatus TaxID=210409 RepID=A0A5B7JPE3_PORTR|nr:hypothetical protein [Portunus trituberculatus]